MEKGPRKPAQTDAPQESPRGKSRRDKQDDKENVESPELTLDELEPRVAPRSIGTFF